MFSIQLKASFWKGSRINGYSLKIRTRSNVITSVLFEILLTSEKEIELGQRRRGNAKKKPLFRPPQHHHFFPSLCNFLIKFLFCHRYFDTDFFTHPYSINPHHDKKREMFEGYLGRFCGRNLKFCIRNTLWDCNLMKENRSCMTKVTFTMQTALVADNDIEKY